MPDSARLFEQGKFVFAPRIRRRHDRTLWFILSCQTEGGLQPALKVSAFPIRVRTFDVNRGHFFSQPFDPLSLSLSYGPLAVPGLQPSVARMAHCHRHLSIHF